MNGFLSPIENEHALAVSFLVLFAMVLIVAGAAVNNAGIFILISSKDINSHDIMDAYYTRQTVEQVFGVAKSDLELLPIRCHSNKTIRGYLFLQFLLLIVFLEMRKKRILSQSPGKCLPLSSD